MHCREGSRNIEAQMKLKSLTQILLFLLVQLSALPVLAQDVRRPPDPPSPVGLSPGPVYLYSDQAGIFSLQVPTIGLVEQFDQRHYLTDSELAALREYAASQGFEVSIVASSQLKSARSPFLKSSGSCPIPSSLTIAQASGVLSGNQISYSSNKGIGESTQWAVMVFSTSNYSGKNSHSGTTLLFQDVLHGLGAIYGNNSQWVRRRVH
jgi:hypothetical protein